MQRNRIHLLLRIASQSDRREGWAGPGARRNGGFGVAGVLARLRERNRSREWATSWTVVGQLDHATRIPCRRLPKPESLGVVYLVRPKHRLRLMSLDGKSMSPGSRGLRKRPAWCVGEVDWKAAQPGRNLWGARRRSRRVAGGTGLERRAECVIQRGVVGTATGGASSAFSLKGDRACGMWRRDSGLCVSNLASALVVVAFGMNPSTYRLGCGTPGERERGVAWDRLGARYPQRRARAGLVGSPETTTMAVSACRL